MSLIKAAATVLLSAAFLAAGCRKGEAERRAEEAGADAQAAERGRAMAAAAERHDALAKSLEGKWYARVGKPEEGVYADMTIDFQLGSRYELTNAMRTLRSGSYDVHSTGAWDVGDDDVVELNSSSPPPPGRGDEDTHIKFQPTIDPAGPRVTALNGTGRQSGTTFTRQPLPKAGPLMGPSQPRPPARPATAPAARPATAPAARSATGPAARSATGPARITATPPPGWDPAPAQAPNLVAAYRRADDPQNQAIAVHAFAPPPARTLRGWAEMNAVSARLRNGRARTVTSQAVPVAGGEGWSLVLELPNEDGGGASRVIQLLAVKGGQGVSVTITVPADRTEEAIKLAQDVMTSIQPRP